MNRSINLRTPIPGPETTALLERRHQSLPRGIGALTVGHANATVIRAAAEQFGRLAEERLKEGLDVHEHALD